MAAVEGIYQIRTKKLIILSLQHLVDFDKKNCSCRGGSLNRVFDFIQKNRIIFEAVYPYMTKEGEFAVKENSPLLFIDGYTKVPENEDSLLKAVANQPVSAAINSICLPFRSYNRVYQIIS
ncbi:Vignain [Platanthera zijinensis]|uniref:Vignain n=1 Tax=Platanthera zijinensis TaxID=2320716 RepID=A0AAP0B010_9ASPA